MHPTRPPRHPPKLLGYTCSAHNYRGLLSEIGNYGGRNCIGVAAGALRTEDGARTHVRPIGFPALRVMIENPATQTHTHTQARALARHLRRACGACISYVTMCAPVEKIQHVHYFWGPAGVVPIPVSLVPSRLHGHDQYVIANRSKLHSGSNRCGDRTQCGGHSSSVPVPLTTTHPLSPSSIRLSRINAGQSRMVGDRPHNKKTFTKVTDYILGRGRGIHI